MTTIVQDVLSAIERVLLPKLQEIESKLNTLQEQVKGLATKEQVHGLRELMDEKFKRIEDKLALDRRVSALEEEQAKKPN